MICEGSARSNSGRPFGRSNDRTLAITGSLSVAIAPPGSGLDAGASAVRGDCPKKEESGSGGLGSAPPKSGITTERCQKSHAAWGVELPEAVHAPHEQKP